MPWRATGVRPRGALLALAVVLTWGLAGAGSAAASVTAPFEVIGRWLDGCEESTLKGAGAKNVQRALKASARVWARV
jgi:hypothetical protein